MCAASTAQSPLHTPGICLAAGLLVPVTLGGAMALATEPLCHMAALLRTPLNGGQIHMDIFLPPEQDRQALPPYMSLQPELWLPHTLCPSPAIYSPFPNKRGLVFRCLWTRCSVCPEYPRPLTHPPGSSVMPGQSPSLLLQALQVG